MICSHAERLALAIREGNHPNCGIAGQGGTVGLLIGIEIGFKKGKTIQVAELYDFPESRWRQGILRFLFGIWSGDPAVTAKPEILIQGITLRLIGNRYVAFGTADSGELPEVVTTAESLLVGDRKADVEVALAEFVKNDRIKMVTLTLGADRNRLLTLWKKERRGEFGFWTNNIPKIWIDKY